MFQRCFQSLCPLLFRSQSLFQSIDLLLQWKALILQSRPQRLDFSILFGAFPLCSASTPLPFHRLSLLISHSPPSIAMVYSHSLISVHCPFWRLPDGIPPEGDRMCSFSLKMMCPHRPLLIKLFCGFLAVDCCTSACSTMPSANVLIPLSVSLRHSQFPEIH